MIIFMRCLGTRAEPVWNQPAAPALMEQASEAGELAVSCPSRWSQRNIVQQCTGELGQFFHTWPTGKGAPKATDWRAPVGIAVLPLLAHVLMDPSRL